LTRIKDTYKSAHQKISKEEVKLNRNGKRKEVAWKLTWSVWRERRLQVPRL
jgi:hypothetical protein